MTIWAVLWYGLRVYEYVSPVWTQRLANKNAIDIQRRRCTARGGGLYLLCTYLLHFTYITPLA